MATTVGLKTATAGSRRTIASYSTYEVQVEDAAADEAMRVLGGMSPTR